MSSDIISLLQLDKPFDTSRVLVANEINGCDSSFLISCILTNCIKNKSSILLVSTHNSLSHYKNVGMKMNCNLQKHVDSGLVNFLNIGDQIVQQLLNQNTLSIEKVFTTIQEIITKMQQEHTSVNVIFDGVSHLIDLQYTLKDINIFCQKLIKCVRGSGNSFILFHCNMATEEDPTRVLANLLSHKAHTVVEVESLSSGWSADVNGRLTIKHSHIKFEEGQTYTYIMDLKPTKYLFKLFDRGVKLFAPGTV